MKASTEKAFETYIHQTMAERGWISGSVQCWDKQQALFAGYVLSFIRETQGSLWTQMEKLHVAELPGKLINTLLKERDPKAVLPGRSSAAKGIRCILRGIAPVIFGRKCWNGRVSWRSSAVSSIWSPTKNPKNVGYRVFHFEAFDCFNLINLGVQLEKDWSIDPHAPRLTLLYLFRY